MWSEDIKVFKSIGYVLFPKGVTLLYSLYLPYLLDRERKKCFIVKNKLTSLDPSERLNFWQVLLDGGHTWPQGQSLTPPACAEPPGL